MANAVIVPGWHENPGSILDEGGVDGLTAERGAILLNLDHVLHAEEVEFTPGFSEGDMAGVTVLEVVLAVPFAERVVWLDKTVEELLVLMNSDGVTDFEVDCDVEAERARRGVS